MKNESENENLLPKMLPGTVHEQFVRCGKQNCKCARGELHGAYYYHFVRVNGKLTKRYLKQNEIEPFNAACFARQREQQAERIQNANLCREFREIRSVLRETSNLINLGKVLRK